MVRAFLPDAFDPASLKAELHEGVLRVTADKRHAETTGLPVEPAERSACCRIDSAEMAQPVANAANVRLTDGAASMPKLAAAPGGLNDPGDPSPGCDRMPGSIFLACPG